MLINIVYVFIVAVMSTCMFMIIHAHYIYKPKMYLTCNYHKLYAIITNSCSHVGIGNYLYNISFEMLTFKFP